MTLLFQSALHWARPLHKINCDIAFPKELDDFKPNSPSLLDSVLDLFVAGRGCGGDHHLLELDTPQYAGRIRNEKIMEKLLAMGGVRLAAVLNDLFDPPVGGAPGGVRNFEWNSSRRCGAFGLPV